MNSNIIPAEYEGICDFEAFFKYNNKSKADSIKKVGLYFELLGIVHDLADYRQKFLTEGNFIDLFPTAYFHTTAKEIVNIANRKYDYPTEKMIQIIAFYEAYKYNRALWDSGYPDKIEDHWRIHFKSHDFDWKWIKEQMLFDPNFSEDGFAINQLQLALGSAIHAHVEIDLPRAIRYAFLNRNDKSLSYNDIKKDFDDTNPIFSNTQAKTLQDFKSIYPTILIPTFILNWGAQFFGPDVVSLRQISWQKASSSEKLTNHPIFLNHLQLRLIGQNICKTVASSTSLLLIDVSGSMSSNNKFADAKQSAMNTINTVKQDVKQSGKVTEIGIMAFSGGCIPNPTQLVQDFTHNLDQVLNSVNAIPAPNGGTPLPQAVERAKEVLEARLTQNGTSCGSLIILGDGQSSCGAIRPPDSYVGPPVVKKICGQQTSGGTGITFYTVGFGIEPGSVAERDLQYLATTSGGKYFNAQDEYQLTRSLQKINRIYSPVVQPQNQTLEVKWIDLFQKANDFVSSTQQYDSALFLYEQYVNAYSSDSSGIYNLALMYEANERYKSSSMYYELYLKNAPGDTNRQYLLEKIETLHKDYQLYLDYSKKILQSDLNYLESHFNQLMNTPNAVPLAGEFAGFIKEKQPFYAKLQEHMEMSEPWLKQYGTEISQAMKKTESFLSKKPKEWDMNGISLIGGIYMPMEKLIKKMNP